MANRKQIGTDYLLFVNVGTPEAPEWKIPLCQTTVTVNTPMLVIDANSKCGPDSMIDNDVETIDFEGQILQQDPTNTSHMSLYELRQLYRTKEVHQFKVGPKGTSAEDEGKIVYSFDGRLTNLSDTYPNQEVGTVTGSISVVGEIEETEFVQTT